MRSADTSEEARLVQLAVYRRMTGEERLVFAVELSEAARAISKAGAEARVGRAAG